MPRIRSIHPDQWTDERFVDLSMEARILVIGLRNFADDNGVFEWKPKTIKMKIFPADDVDVDALLMQILTQLMCIRFTSNGRQYGAIRNFLKYQRPKNPTIIHPINKEIADYVGLKGEFEASEIDVHEQHQFPHQSGNDAEIPFQREEGRGGGNIDLGKPKSCSFDAFWEIWPNRVAKQAAKRAWSGLSEANRTAALEHLRGGWFERWRASKPQASPIHPATFLNGKRWEDSFAHSQLAAIPGGKPRAGDKRTTPAGIVQTFDAQNGWVMEHN